MELGQSCFCRYKFRFEPVELLRTAQHELTKPIKRYLKRKEKNTENIRKPCFHHVFIMFSMCLTTHSERSEALNFSQPPVLLLMRTLPLLSWMLRPVFMFLT